MDEPRFRPTPTPRGPRRRRCARIVLLDAQGDELPALVRDSSSRGLSAAVLGAPPAIDTIVRARLAQGGELWGLVRWRDGNLFGVEFDPRPDGG